MEEPASVIQHLPTELLINIFQNLKAPDLCRMAQTCKRFYEIIENYYDKFFEDKEPLVTNQMSPQMIKRSHRLLNPLKKYIVLENWKNEHYQKRYFQDMEALHSPSLQLTRDYFWWTTGRDVKAYKRLANGNVDFSQFKRFKSFHHDIVNSFIVKDDLMLVGGRSGAMWMYSLTQDQMVFGKEGSILENAEIGCLAWVNNLIVAGFPFGCFNLFIQQDYNLIPVPTIDYKLNRYRYALALSPDATCIAAGELSALRNYSVNILDVESGKRKETVYFWGGDRPTQISWESPSVLWISEKMGSLVRWDFRSDEIAQQYKGPRYSGINCFQFDHKNTMITGAKEQGRVTLWDTRQNERYVQDYNMSHSSGIGMKGLDFDSEFLFGATDKYLCALDFSPSSVRNYISCKTVSKM